MLEEMPSLLSYLAIFFTGLSKAGFSGISLIGVGLLADLYESKPSVGILLPLLVAADLIVYPMLRKRSSWKPVWRILPPTLVGMALGFWLLAGVNNELAARLIGGIILLLVVLQLSKKRWPRGFERVAGSKRFAWALGALGGVATALANAAGPIMSLYFLAQNLNKYELVGVGARFFLLINFLKVPLLLRLDLITSSSLVLDLWLLPMLIFGILFGRWLLGKVSQRLFEALVVIAASMTAVKLLFF